ncbi:trypsin II-P29-like [Pygocentrus nattereri]|uniref:trypsin II-P29-like n=1 Tax=Pygocentrus nattereri TaxID=42514 RepID=UPI001890B686|nr:trypsin II-P29-like [Pygocentrus nattereri]
MFTMDKTAFLILSLWAAGVTSSAIEKRLVSSVTCPDAERHHHVRVVYEFGDGKSMTCAGTLIHKQWVITDSHCYGGRNGKLVVEIGGHPKTSVKKQMRVSDIRIYPKSPSDEPIVLLKLPEAAKDIEPAVLPAGTCTAPGDGEELQVSGRGATTADGGQGVKDLMCLEVKTISKNHCTNLAGTSYEKFTYIYCGGGVGGAEIKPCKGDSGSGAVKKEMVSKSSYIFWTTKEKADVLYGVLISGHEECEDKFVFVDICSKSLKKWIDSNVA